MTPSVVPDWKLTMTNTRAILRVDASLRLTTNAVLDSQVEDDQGQITK